MPNFAKFLIATVSLFTGSICLASADPTASVIIAESATAGVTLTLSRPAGAALDLATVSVTDDHLNHQQFKLDWQNEAQYQLREVQTQTCATVGGDGSVTFTACEAADEQLFSGVPNEAGKYQFTSAIGGCLGTVHGAFNVNVAACQAGDSNQIWRVVPVSTFGLSE